MNIKFTITMTPREKEEYKESLTTVKRFLEEFARQTNDDQTRLEVWSEISRFRELLEIFY